jgi:hypothetical protein
MTNKNQKIINILIKAKQLSKDISQQADNDLRTLQQSFQRDLKNGLTIYGRKI